MFTFLLMSLADCEKLDESANHPDNNFKNHRIHARKVASKSFVFPF